MSTLRDTLAKRRMQRIRVLWLAVLFVLAVVCATAAAQSTEQEQGPGGQQSSQQKRPPLNVTGAAVPGEDSSIENETTDGALPASRIIEILRQEPDFLTQVKRLAVARAAEQGKLISDSDLSDDILFRRITEDSDLRRRITNELKDRGYLSDDELESLTPARRGERPTAAEERSRAAGTLPSTEALRDLPQLSRRMPPGEETAGAVRRPIQRPSTPSAQPPAEDLNQPSVSRRLSPYANLPSLRDLYSQFPSQPDKLKRFGADIFFNGSSNLDEFPMDLPAGPDYVLGPGDGLNIDIWGSVSQRLTRTVDREGRIALPEAGTIVVAGQTLGNAQQGIQKALSTQFHSVKVDVSLTRLRTVRVYVVGDVQRPGAYDISSLSTPLNALYAAGGPTLRGSLRTVRHYRGQQLVREVDLYELILHGVRTDVERLQAGDTILVPPVGPQVAVAGMVRRPAIYELKGEAPLGETLDLAGGVLVSATLRQIKVERIQANDRRIMLNVNLPANDNNDPAALKKALGDFQVRDGDRVTIAPILPYSEKTVYLEGHVFRPGKYPYHDGIKITDLIASYQDLLPEPATHAEIIRLVPPDYHPATIEVNLEDVLSGDDPLDLQPFDTVRVYGRYQIDAPKVSIFGEVLRPGEYPLAHGMTAAALVRMAGGFKRSAFKETADLSSYVVQNGEKILTDHKTVHIANALDGEAKADMTLKPGDILSVRRLSGWEDIGASVTLSGEVVHPGTYGIREGERLSSLLKRAGGFRSTAYPTGAVLERAQVRQIAEKSRQELIRRIDSQGTSINIGGSGSDQAAMVQAMQQQRQQVVSALRNQPATGRLVIDISSDISRWENTAADIEIRKDDTLTIPKRPDFVLVNGQVYTPTAITYRPGQKAAWYLRQAGGPTDLANKGAIFVIRANGSVVGGNQGWFGGSVLDTRLRPGDSVVVPDKIIGGSMLWKNLLTTAQMVSSVAITAAAVTSF